MVGRGMMRGADTLLHLAESEISHMTMKASRSKHMQTAGGQRKEAHGLGEILLTCSKQQPTGAMQFASDRTSLTTEERCTPGG